MGYQADTNAPLPPAPSTPRGVYRSGPQDPSLALRQAMGELVGPKAECEILPNGQVGAVFMNELTNAIQNPQVAQSMQSGMTPKDMIEGFVGQYPETPVGVGAIWHIARERDVPGSPEKVSIEMEYELTELKDSPTGKIATITYYGNIDKDINANNNGVTVRKMDLTLKGLMHVDVSSGIQLDNVGTMTGTAEAEAQGKTAKIKLDMNMGYAAVKLP